MELIVSWQDAALRIAAAIVAALIVGWNREERSEAAGLRTTVLVCLAACIAMLLANLLLPTAGKDQSKFAQIDVLRLPLGVLSGIGFIGAGAIIKRGDIVTGVTTAATIWFMTIVGLCLGAGQLALGIAATGIAFLLLWGLRWVDKHMSRRFSAGLTVKASRDGLPEETLRSAIRASGHDIVLWAVTYEDAGAHYEARTELQWRGHERDRSVAPEFVRQLGLNPAVLRADWEPAQIGG